MTEAPALALMQQWVHRCITHPSDVSQGAVEASSTLGLGADGAAELIRASPTLTALDCLAIYRNAYFLRLMEVLNAEYPALKLALGDSLFEQFALFFLQQQPSVSYTLCDLSRGFPDFLQASVPPEESESAWPAFIIGLARLERIFQEVYRGPGIEGQARRAPGPPRPAPSMRLMEASYPVHEFLVAARKEQCADWPAPCATFLAITRLDYVVKIHALDAQEYACLRDWPASGTINDAPGMPMGKWLRNGLLV